MVLSGEGWYSVVLSGEGWYSVACSGEGWYSVACSGEGWYSVVLSGEGWYSVACSGEGWYSVVLSGEGWYSVACSGEGWYSVGTIPCQCSSSSTPDYMNPEIIGTLSRSVTPHQHGTETNEGAPIPTSERNKEAKYKAGQSVWAHSIVRLERAHLAVELAGMVV